MPRLWVRIVLFISSYFPLTVIFALLNWDKHRHWSIMVLSIGIISLVILYIYFFFPPLQRGSINTTIKTVERRDSDVLNYIAAYIIPFVTIEFDKWQTGVSVLILFLVLGIIYVNSNLIAVNPMLNLIGYHLYQIGFGDADETYLVLSRRNLVRNYPMNVIKLEDEMYFVRKVRHTAREPTDSDIADE